MSVGLYVSVRICVDMSVRICVCVWFCVCVGVAPDDKAVFGVDLSESVQRSGGVRAKGTEGYVPLFCRDIFDYLLREGASPKAHAHAYSTMREGERRRGGRSRLPRRRALTMLSVGPAHVGAWVCGRAAMGMHTENLKVEGLFRVPGNQSRIQDLRERVDKTGGPIDLKNAQIHVRRTLGTRRGRKEGGREGGRGL
jgi:hypothetical protein